MSKYEKYKKSEFVGIGEVPTHWEVKRLKHLGDAIIGLTYSPNDVTENEEGILVLRSSNIQEGIISFEDCVYVDKEVNPNLITRKGDILICARNGSAHLVGKNICIDENSAGHTFGAFMVVFRGKYWRYLSYFFNSPIFTSQTGMFSTTTINQLTSQTLNNLRIAYPSDKTEQDNICNYLDHQTQKIDRLIANKKAQAEKLKEIRQIEINNSVTKGLNPNAEMKDSGIEWLGKIPKHWEVKRMKKFTTKIGSGVTPKGGSEIYEETGIPLFRSQNIHFDGLRTDDIVYITEEVHQAMSGSKVEANDVLLNITGASIGRCYYYDGSLGEANVNQHVCILRTNSKLDYRYLQQFISSDCGQSQIFIGQTGTSREGLNFQDIKNIFILTPPPNEQIEITVFVKIKTNAIDKLIKNVETQIEKLQELRKIKIYEAVTGKIKVPA